MSKVIPIFYRAEQSCAVSVSFSPSAGKPALVVADYLKHFSDLVEIQSFEPATPADLTLAHDAKYVSGVLDGTVKNGFDTFEKEIAESLPYTTGSLMAAARHVLTENNQNASRIAVSPTSGFHHAGYNYGSAFCTFNGLMVTAIKMHELGLARRILIMDFDQHYGDGTDDIIEHLGIDYVTHVTAWKSYNTKATALKAARYLFEMAQEPYDLVLYQAGADIHVDDPLGGLLTTEEMITRDYSVMTGCLMRNIPLVWNLAG
ncbi:MAG: hypothetical protein V4710_08965, partial [Verrucomicrobiota bacterium]